VTSSKSNQNEELVPATGNSGVAVPKIPNDKGGTGREVALRIYQPKQISPETRSSAADRA
jgi:hypothetical protein